MPSKRADAGTPSAVCRNRQRPSFRFRLHFSSMALALENVQPLTGCALWSGHEAMRILCHDAQAFGLHPCTSGQPGEQRIERLVADHLEPLCTEKVAFEKCILYHGRLVD